MDTAGRDDARARDAELVLAARGGDGDAFGALYERWFDRVHDLAFRITRDEQSAGDVVQDAFLAAWRALGDLEDPGAFGGWLLRITRNRAYNQGRSAPRSRPVDGETMAMIERTQAEGRVEEVDEPAQVAADGELAALVWESVDALGARDAEVLDLSLRHGLTPAEVADVVGTNRNAANQMVHRARVRLGDAIRARVLWRGGEPQCGDLADALHDAHVERFDAEAVRVTTRHAESCDLCRERRRLRLDPAVMFAAVPMVGAPVLLKQRVAHALAEQGVPMGGATGAGPGGAPDPGPPHDAGPAAPGGDPEGTPNAPTSGARHRVRHVLALVTAALLVLGAVVAFVAAESIDDDPAPRRALVEDTVVPSSTTAAPTTVAPSTTAPPAVADTTAPAAAPPATEPAPPLSPPPPTAAPVRVGIGVQPPGAPMTYLRTAAPVLSWSADGPFASVEVSGPGFSSTAPSGSAPVCPTASNPMWSLCVAQPGPSTYTIVARAADGAVLATMSATLTVT